MLDNKIIGKTIAALRQANGMTQQKLAATMNVSHQAVSKWETGAALPDMQTMLELTRLFGVTMEQLLTGEVPEERLQPRQEAVEAVPGFDVFGAVKDVMNGIGSWFKAPEAKPADGEADAEAAQAGETPEEVKEAPAAAEAPEEEAQGEAPAEEAPEEASSEEEAPKEESPEEEEKQEKGTSLDMEKIHQMAPFLSRTALEALVKQYSGPISAKDVARLAPFLSEELLEQLILRVDGAMDWNMLRRLAPFLRTEMVDRLTMALIQGERAVRPAVENMARAAVNLGRHIQRQAGEVDFDKLGEQISTGFNQAVKEAAKFGESVARDMRETFWPEEKGKNPEKQRSPRARESLKRMFELAMQQGRWDWIAERLDELEDPELRQEIARRAFEAGMEEWVAQNFQDLVSPERVRSALEAGNWDWLEGRLEEIDPSLHPEIAKAAAQAGAWDFLEENSVFMDLQGCAKDIALGAVEADRESLLNVLASEHMSEDEIFETADKAVELGKGSMAAELGSLLGMVQRDQLCLKLAEAECWEALEELVPKADEAAVDGVCLTIARKGEWSRLELYAEHASEDALAQLLDLAVDAGNWQAIEMLEALLK